MNQLDQEETQVWIMYCNSTQIPHIMSGGGKLFEVPLPDGWIEAGQEQIMNMVLLTLFWIFSPMQFNPSAKSGKVLCCFFFFFSFNYSWFIMLFQFLLYSKVTHSYIHIYTFFFLNYFSIMIYSKRTDIVPCAIPIGPCCLSILNVTVCIWLTQSPSLSHTLPHPLGIQKSVLYVGICFYFVDRFIYAMF